MKKSIKHRWKVNILFTVIAILLLCSVILLGTIYNRYFNSVEMTIKSRISKSVDTYFLQYSKSDEEAYANGAFEFVNTFLYKDIMEVWVLDKNGKMIASSSGFSDESEPEYEDYFIALYSEDNMGTKITTLNTGEPITAVTYILRDEANQAYGALRYMISLEKVISQLTLLTLLVIIIFIMLVLLFMMSGAYFIASIVNPINKINGITSEIAKGNFDVRIEAASDDEIGQLSSSINNMAVQLGQIERMKNEFISTVSHEIRTPLTAIKGWGETLQRLEDNDELTQKGLNVIVDETTRLSSMVEELLDFSRIQTGNMKIQKEKILLNTAVEQTYTIYNQRAKVDNKEFTLEIENKELYIFADTDKIKQVFINILDNAFKYTDNNGKILFRLEKYKKYAKITVADNGCGIRTEALKHVKEKFFKANNTNRGTGIGLAVVDEIIKLHNGVFHIDSIYEKGTTVTLLIPLYIKEAE